ncbi:hypothetical protein B1810_14035 [Panacagrimonas perspica]|nr:hypothetical protein B1810_14035 [Panacagrimonas perspica]
MAHHRDYPSTASEERNLMADAYVLIERYTLRNDPTRALTAEQRKAWAAEAATVLGALRTALSRRLEPNDDRAERERRKAWVHQFVTGFRPVKPLDSDPESWRPEPPFWMRNGREPKK